MSGDAGARRQAASEYVRALFGPAQEGSLVEVRFRVRSGMAQRFMPASGERDVVDAVLSLASRTEVFVGVLPRARRGGRIADVVTRSRVLWADCDTSASVAALASFEPRPSMVVASGSDQHLHAYWFLQDPVDLDRLEHLNRRLAAALGADGGAVTKPHTILRPAGSLNTKHSPPAPVRLIGLQERHRLSADQIDLLLPRERTEPASTSHAGLSRASLPVTSSDLLRSVPPPVYFERLTGLRVGRSGKLRCLFHDLSVGEATAGAVMPARSHANASSRDRVSADPLLLVPPPVYFERLTGLRVGRSGKLRCLFHDDRHPSLHVYQEAGRGWYCFGCGRGGSVYDLAALLWGRKTRGGDFVELRRELEKLLLL
jgi:CHC2 zinc finger